MSNPIIPDFLFSNKDTFDIYHINSLFKEYVLQKEYYPYQFDGWGDKKFYGIVDNKKNIIYPKPFNLKYHTTIGNNAHKNIAFVTDAFTDLKNYYDQLYSQGKHKNISIFTKLKIAESTENAENLYLNYVGSVYDIFYKVYSKELENKFSNINDFIPFLIRFFKSMSIQAPINRGAFFKSHLAPRSINGLRISISDSRKNADIKSKTNLFINNQDFDLFLENAAKFGFFIDRNEPWTIVADIESPAMKKYIKNYNINNTDDVFNIVYFKTYEADLDSLKNLVIFFWNKFVERNALSINTKDLASCKNIFAEVHSLKKITIKSLDHYFGIDWLLRLYIFTRLLEEKLNVTQNKFDSLHREACAVNKAYDSIEASLFINQKIEEIIALKLPVDKGLTNENEITTLLRNQKIKLPSEGINF